MGYVSRAEFAGPDSGAPPGPPTQRGARTLAFWAAAALVSGFGVLVLPFRFPPAVATFSTSYAYGFGNRAAEIFAVADAAAVLVLLWILRLGRRAPEPSAAETMPRLWLWLACAVAVLFTAALGGAVVHANLFYSDAGHFITQLSRVIRDHAVLYRDVEFPYGPIFFYWPATMQRVLAHLGVSAAAAYMVTLATMQVAGIAMLFYVLHRLPLSRGLRLLALALFTFGTLTPLLGMNYTLFRFLLPHALFFGIVRMRSVATQSALFAVAQLTAFGFSPELGVALLGGVGCYALYRGFTENRHWLSTGASALAATLAFFVLETRNYSSVMGHFAAGAFNLVVMPDFHILILLIAAIALSPVAVAGYLQSRDPRAAGLLGFFLISLGMLAPALGRCDPLHTFFGGLGLYLLSLVAVNGLHTWSARAWVLALSFCIVGYQVDDLRVYMPLMRHVAHPDPPSVDGVDMARLEALTRGGRIAVPVLAPQRVTNTLIRLGQYQPSYFVFMGGVWDDESERRKIADLRRAPFALIPNKSFELTHPDFEGSRISRLFRLGYRYHLRRAPWVQGAALARELREHWTPLGSVGEFTVYRQDGAGPEPISPPALP